MKFSYAIGNPPYQETKGGTKNVDIWPDFVKESTKIADKSCMIHPGRWVIPTKARQNLHNEMLNANLKTFNYFPISGKVFDNVSIDGGISITLFDQNFTGDTTYFIDGENKGIYKDEDKFFSDKYEEEAYTKVFKHITTNMLDYVLGGIGALSAVDLEQAKHLHDSAYNLVNPIKIWTSKASGKGNSKYEWYFIEKDQLKQTDEKVFSTRKVMLDKKGHAITHGKGNVINNLPQICDRNCTGDNVLWIFPNKITDRQTDRQTDRYLLLLKSLFMTKTARYLMCITQKSLYVRGFENIPDYIELAKLLPEDKLFTDEWFYKTFDFSEGLINEIETRVSPKVDKEV